MTRVHDRFPLSATPTVLAAGVLFGVLSAGHLVAQLVGAGGAARISQWLLMPVLAAAVWSATTGAPRSRAVRLVLLALAFSWLGDSVPAFFSGDARFLTMVGLFLCAQVVYVAAFWPWRRRSALRRPAVVWYVLAFGALLAACGPGAGALLGPVVGYGLCLTLMAVLATGVGRVVGIGGAVFFVSDGLIALEAFAGWYDPPAPGFWVMLTYLAGQALIAAGVCGHPREGEV
ncbi:lysoplasmalogenase [Saccharothrix sp. 6-C]|uniref:lysoplasmalogenase n=1 Tax=Saccharothrix sp. 6-C TaxID=2781735 RepID=UPI00191749C6|nr:lysoplasmalogenase [Saccharothrix sp. 6-C]QQQ78239.1 lysoplasmalogenase [Saccharothrix sp. 6-C]